jgi:hypothetical protein
MNESHSFNKCLSEYANYITTCKNTILKQYHLNNLSNISARLRLNYSEFKLVKPSTPKVAAVQGRRMSRTSAHAHSMSTVNQISPWNGLSQSLTFLPEDRRLEERDRIGPGIHGTGSARKLAVIYKAHALELGRFSTSDNFHRQVLRSNKVFVLTYFDRKIFPSENCSTSVK